MIETALAKAFGTKHDRYIKRVQPMVVAINELEPQMQKLSDQELAAKTVDFKQRVANGASLDDILIEAFAVCREASRRVLNMRHFDVQLIGGMVLHRGRIAEMKTGEGKTLVATLPSYLNALEGKGVHIVTVNDYLARRDSEWMGRIHKFLGLSVGTIVHDLDEEQRREAYGSDITYGTNNEFGFDYLRDNMKFRLEDYVQRDFNFAIVDEVDSILIDEARTPLIIAGPSEESTDKYYRINRIIPSLVRGEVIEGKEPGQSRTTGDFTVDEKHRSVALTEEGVLKVEKLLNTGNLYDPANIEMNHHVQQGLRAHILYERDRDYVVQEGQVIIVDEFTGRLMPGRRWSDGLHQAVEAKENVKIERETQTLASVTFQNFFRMYKKLAGMTGTADTEEAEFQKIYNLDVTVVPTNKTDDSPRESGHRLSNRRREVSQRGQGNQSASRKGPARSGGHHFGPKVGASLRHSQKDGHSPRSAECQKSRTRSAHRGAGRPQRRGHRFNQHGRPRHRYSAGRQSGCAARRPSEEIRQGAGNAAARGVGKNQGRSQGRNRGRAQRSDRLPAAYIY